MAVVYGIDPSLSMTGLAHVDTVSGEWITHRVGSKPPREGDLVKAQARRLRRIARAVRDFPASIEPPFGDVDLVVLEGMSFGSRTAGARDLAGLWWRLVDELDGRFSCRLLVVEPSTRMKYAAGRGRGVAKSEVLAAVRATYPAVDVPTHDVADAVSLAALGARVLGLPVEPVARPWMEDVAQRVCDREEKKEAARG